MTFVETLNKQLQAIKKHDIDMFVTTLHENEDIVCIEPDGKYIYSYTTFIENHISWFDDKTWDIDFEILNIQETLEISIATTQFKLTETNGVYHMILSLVFKNIDGKWGLIHDQNTPIKNN